MTPVSSPPFTLTAAVAEDAAAFARLLAAAYVVPLDGTGRTTLADAELARRVLAPVSTEFQLADWAMMRLAPEETLTPFQYGMLDAAERIIGLLAAAPAFHPQFAELLNRHRGLFAAAALPADGWITNPAHPARALLASLYAVAAGWHPELGAGAVTTRAQAESWLVGLVGSEFSWAQAASAAKAWHEDERKRVERIEKRLVDTESGAMRERRARQLAARTLNQALAGRVISREVGAMLVADWLPAMQWTLVRQGEQGPLWQRLKRTTGMLRWTLSPEISDDGPNKLYRLVSQVSEELLALAPQVFHDAGARERVLAIIDEEHLCVVRNLPRDTAPFAAVDAHDALADASTEMSSNLVERATALVTGQWLLLQEAGQSRRVRLLLKQEETRQMLFVNALGVKALATSFEAIALRLADGTAEVLPEKMPLAAAIVATVEATRVRQQQAQQSRIELLRAAREQAAADARIKEAARQKALAEAQALESARREAQQRADLAQQEAESARRVTEAAQQLAESHARELVQQRQQRARLMASSLTIGTWLVFRDSEGREERRRLSVILPSSGKYIFVDADGTGKRDVNRDELIRSLADGSIVALSRDQKLDDALTRVVDNIRGDRGQGTS